MGAAEAEPARTAGTAPAATTNAAWTIRRERGRDMVLLVEMGTRPVRRADVVITAPGARRLRLPLAKSS
jgi:hypothetical protein